MEWICLDWNQPSIDFYINKIKAIPLDEWTVYRVTAEKFKILFKNVEIDKKLYILVKTVQIF